MAECADTLSSTLCTEFAGLDVTPAIPIDNRVKRYIDRLMHEQEKACAHTAGLFDRRLAKLEKAHAELKKDLAESKKDLAESKKDLAESTKQNAALARRVHALEHTSTQKAPPKTTQEKEPEAALAVNVGTGAKKPACSEEAWHTAKVKTKNMWEKDQYKQTGIDTFAWKIHDYHVRLLDAQYGGHLYWESEAFELSSYLFKLFIYPAGGDNLGNHLGIYFAAVPGPTDWMLQWPLLKEGTFSLPPIRPDQHHICNRITGTGDGNIHKAVPDKPLALIGTKNWQQNNVINGYLVDDALEVVFKLCPKQETP